MIRFFDVPLSMGTRLLEWFLGSGISMAALSLRQCLEHLAALEADYLLTDNQGMEWTATGLLASLTRDHPDRLDVLVYLRLPDAQRDGAIYQATQRGGFIRWYRIRHHVA